MTDDDIYISQSDFTRKWNEINPKDTVSRQYISKLVNTGEFPQKDKKIPFNKCKSILENKKNNPEREAQREANKAKKEGSIGLFNEENICERTLADLNEQEKEEFYKTRLEIEDLSKEIDENLDDDSFKNKSFNDIKKLKEYYQGLKAKLDYEKECELLVLKEDVERAAYEISRITRNKLLSIPARVSSIVASMNDKREVQSYIYDEIYNALSELERELQI
ncbi:hypothetical protein O8C86_05795 [Aliarcobacter butzleri]|uniref:hypothetical protein n=1 Tax=Aliarcobacter butzleri TaxID=28197 RepID=UPI00263DAC41|nr:hypothetical protein [Aliarcobacter butzleri]MDN5061354.1 hypothetical protein [Aliarcobacter butzleri]